MRTLPRMLAVATLTMLTALPAAGAQAGPADERGQQSLERTLAREHHAAPGPTNRAEQAAELALARTLAREHGAYPAPAGNQTAINQATESGGPTTLVAVAGMVGLTVLLIAAAAFLWLRTRAHPREAT
jgi:hypothetical protein